MPRRDGIDVSKWQGSINWLAALGAGIWWAATRSYDRDLNRTDEQFAANRAGMAPARYRLLYYWLEPGDATLQARLYLDTIGALADGEGVMLDAEQDGITEDGSLSWLTAVEAVTGRPAAVYTGAYVAGGTIWDSTRIFNGQRPRILAAYCTEDEARGHARGAAWDAWQWTASGNCPGVAGPVDCDQVEANGAAFDAVCRHASAPPNPEGDDDMPAQYVYKNAAGQAIVNENGRLRTLGGDELNYLTKTLKVAVVTVNSETEWTMLLNARTIGVHEV